MRSAPAAALVLALTAAALLPGVASAAENHGAHGAEGPANPMVKAVTLFLDGSGALTPAPAAAGTVPAGPAMVDGTSAPVSWSVAATRNTKLDSSVYVELYYQVTQPTLVAGGPEGNAFTVQLTHNGEPVEGAATSSQVESSLLQPGEPQRLKIFLPQKEVLLAPGDAFGVQVTFYGLNPEGQPAVHYVVGGETGSRLIFRLRMASLDEVDLPRDQLGAGTLAPLEGFDFQQESKKDPRVKEFALKAFQFGFRPAPIVVPNNTKVVLHITVDESLSTANEGHDAHGHMGNPNLGWDANEVVPLHGFSLASLDPRLSTVEFDGLVTTLKFTAVGPGNYTFICTVVCGTGHGRMVDKLVIEGPLEEQTLGPGAGAGSGDQGPRNQVQGFEALAGLAAMGLAVLAMRRR